MTPDTTEQLARELARHAGAVRRLPGLRAATVRVLAAASLGSAALLAGRGMSLAFLQASSTLWVFAMLVTGLTLIGSGATLLALALGIPGREAAARAGLASTVLGLLLALGWLPVQLAQANPLAAVPWSADLTCLLAACAVGTPPALVALWFVAHAVPQRPGLAVLAAAAGAVGLGALAAKASCPVEGLRHLLLGHALAPIGGALLLVMPLLAFRRVMRRS